LRHGQGLQQGKATTANVQRITIFLKVKLGVKKSGERRIGVVRLTSGEDAIEALRILPGFLQKLLARLSAQCSFVFLLGGVRHRDDASAASQFSRGHAERVIDLFRGDDTRAKRAGRTNYIDFCGGQSRNLFRYQPSRAQKEKIV